METVKTKIKIFLNRIKPDMDVHGIEKLKNGAAELESEIERLKDEIVNLKAENSLLKISNESFVEEITEIQKEGWEINKKYFKNRHELEILKNPMHFGQVVPKEAAFAILHLLPDANYFMNHVRTKTDLKRKSESFKTQRIDGKVFVNDCRNDANEEGAHRIIFNVEPLDIRIEINCIRVKKSYSISGINTTADMFVWDLKNLYLLNGEGCDFLESSLIEMANLRISSVF